MNPMFLSISNRLFTLRCLRQMMLVFLSLVLNGCGDTPERKWQLTTQGAYSFALSPDARFALVGSILHGGSLWRLQDGERVYNWNHAKGSRSELIAVGFSPDSAYAATAEKKRLVLWRISDGRPLGFWPVNAGALALAVSKQGKYILIGQENYSAILIETATNSIVAKLPHSGDVNTVAISANGRIGVTGSEDGYVRIWNLQQETELHRFKLGDDISMVAVSADGRLAFGSRYYGKAHIWNLETGERVSTIGFPRITISAARFSNDKKTLLTGDTVRRVMEWQVNSGKKLNDWAARPPTFYPPSGLVINSVAYGQNNRQVYAGFSNGSIMQWHKNQ